MGWILVDIYFTRVFKLGDIKELNLLESTYQ